MLGRNQRENPRKIGGEVNNFTNEYPDYHGLGAWIEKHRPNMKADIVNLEDGKQAEMHEDPEITRRAKEILADIVKLGAITAYGKMDQGEYSIIYTLGNVPGNVAGNAGPDTASSKLDLEVFIDANLVLDQYIGKWPNEVFKKNFGVESSFFGVFPESISKVMQGLQARNFDDADILLPLIETSLKKIATLPEEYKAPNALVDSNTPNVDTFYTIVYSCPSNMQDRGNIIHTTYKFMVPSALGRHLELLFVDEPRLLHAVVDEIASQAFHTLRAVQKPLESSTPYNIKPDYLVKIPSIESRGEEINPSYIGMKFVPKEARTHPDPQRSNTVIGKIPHLLSFYYPQK